MPANLENSAVTTGLEKVSFHSNAKECSNYGTIALNLKGNQSWIFIGRTDAEAQIQYFGHLMWRVDSLVKTLMLGGIRGRRRKGWQRMRWLDGITYSMDMSLMNSGSRWCTGRPGVLRFMGSQRVRHDWVTELNWTELMYIKLYNIST